MVSLCFLIMSVTFIGLDQRISLLRYRNREGERDGEWRYDTRCNGLNCDAQHNDIQQNDTKPNVILHNDTGIYITQHSHIWHNDTEYAETQQNDI